MEYERQRNCVVSNCCFCCSVDTGAKIISNLVIVSNLINLAVNVFAIETLAATFPTAGSNPDVNVTTHQHLNSTAGELNIDANDNAMNLTDYAKANFSDFTTTQVNDIVRFAIIMLGLRVGVNIFIICIHVVILIGLQKRSASYVKFGLIVSVINLTVVFVLILAKIITAPSWTSLAMLLNIIIPAYSLLVLRSAYCNILEENNNKPKPNSVQPAENICTKL